MIEYDSEPNQPPILLERPTLITQREPVHRDFQQEFRRRKPERANHTPGEPALVVFSLSHDVEVDILSLRLAAHGITLIRIDVEKAVDSFVRFDVVANRLDYEGLSVTPRAVWVRHWHDDAVGPLDRLGSTPNCYVRDQWSMFVDALWTDPRVHAVNSHRADRGLGRIAQLHLAAAVGFRTPETVLTSSPSRAFPTAVPGTDIIVKTIGRHFVEPWPGHIQGLFPQRLTNAAARERPDEPAPVMYQPYLPSATELRVYAVYGEILPYMVAKPDVDALFVEPKEVRITPTVLDHEVHDRVVKYMDSCDANVAALDLLVTENGDVVFLEINFSGDWRPFEVLAGDERVTDAVIAALRKIWSDT